MMKVKKIDLTNLPSDVVSNIASFMVGEPEYLRLKHNEALKKIQRKFKPHFTEVKEFEYEDVMQRIVGRPEIKEIHTRKKLIHYDMVRSKFSHIYPLFEYINRQKQQIKSIILKEIQQLKENDEYQYIKKISVGILGIYADRDNVPEHLQSIYEIDKCIKIENIENLDEDIRQLFLDKNIDEIDFWNEYDIEISSYRFKVGYEIEKIIYKENFRKRN